ncbi:hypothetical protein S2M10_33310 [Sphingomonas sp. S2M10]|uniref:DUF2285 domain-containing protein n=1 Tax=Sphingomonas sp. S2M10 TaxID=2705010 RepID=UPI0016BCB922|nr:DUF2285 domain-containing protein [Sphingomonas sp. S2M10]NLS28321.1 hypothetical protein [Sphingomonas sp. S2M10]
MPLTGIGVRRDSPEGSYALHVGDATIQVLFLPGADPAGPLVALIPIDADMLDRIEALTRFWRSLYGRKVPADTRMTVQQRRRLRLMIQAADGRMSGASYREIGTVIYGAARVAAEPWKTSPLRDAVINLVEGGLAAIGGGYLQLLRHRRKS